MTDMHDLGLVSEDAQIAACVDDAMRDTRRAQSIDGAIDGVALGDAAEIDEQGSLEADAARRPELEVFEGSSSGHGAVARKVFPANELGRNRHVEHAVARLMNPASQRKDREQILRDRHDVPVRVSVDEAQLAGRIVEAHARLHARNRGKRRVDAARQHVELRTGSSNGHERAEERLRSRLLSA